MIIEINGLPGSGKSFFAEKIYKKYKRKIIYVSALEKNSWFRILTRVLSDCLFVLLSKKSAVKYLDYKYCAKRSEFGTGIDIRSYLKRLLFLKFLYKLNAKSNRVIILDEGIVQVVCAIYAEYSIQKSEVVLLFNDMPTDQDGVISIIYQCGIEKAIESIHLRNRHVCGIDMLNDDELRKMFEKYIDIIHIYCDRNYNHLILDRKNAFEVNCAKICREMEKTIK